MNIIQGKKESVTAEKATLPRDTSKNLNGSQGLKINARVRRLHLTSYPWGWTWHLLFREFPKEWKSYANTEYPGITGQYSDDPILTRQVVCKTVGKLLLILIFLENCKFRTTANTNSASGHQTIYLLDVTKTLGNVALAKILLFPRALSASVRNHDTMLCLVTQFCPTLCDPMDCSPPGASVHEDSPGKNTGVGCDALLQEIFPTQESNPGLPNCRQITAWTTT